MNVYFLSRVHYEKAYELNTTNGPYVYYRKKSYE